MGSGVKTLLKNAKIITMEDENVINGDIGIEGDKIAFVGKDENFTADRVVDIKGNIVMPGLINAHTHSAMSVLRSYADDLNLQDWLFKKIFPVEDTFNDKIAYNNTLLACAEMIKSGTTSCADMYFFMPGICKAFAESGMRVNVSRSLTSDENTVIDTDKRLAEEFEAIKNFDGANNGKINVEFSVHAVYTNTVDYLKEVAKIIEDMKKSVHVHISETKFENEECIAKYGVTPTRLLYDCGYFKTHTLAAHCVHLTPEDAEIMRQNDVSIAHNPVSNLKLASGIMPIYKGVNIALGTDSVASNNNLDMFEEMKFAALLPKGINYDPTALSAFDVLKMATVNGAKALGLKNVGMIKKGYDADLIVIDIDKPHLYPLNNPISNIVYSANGGDVLSTMCKGEWLMENRQLKTLDFDKIKGEIIKIM